MLSSFELKSTEVGEKDDFFFFLAMCSRVCSDIYLHGHWGGLGACLL